jgi:hypothetical protein
MQDYRIFAFNLHQYLRATEFEFNQSNNIVWIDYLACCAPFVLQIDASSLLPLQFNAPKNRYYLRLVLIHFINLCGLIIQSVRDMLPSMQAESWDVSNYLHATVLYGATTKNRQHNNNMESVSRRNVISSQLSCNEFQDCLFREFLCPLFSCH